ncbi:MAG: Benzoate transport protein, partial [uncultured Friedmanniella sp.]
GDGRRRLRLLVRPGPHRADRAGGDDGAGRVRAARAAAGDGRRDPGAGAALPDAADAGLVDARRRPAGRRRRRRGRLVGRRRDVPAGRRADRPHRLVALAVADAGRHPAGRRQRDARRRAAADLRHRLHDAGPDAALRRADPAHLARRVRRRPALGRAAGPARRAGRRGAHAGRHAVGGRPGPPADLDGADVRLAAAAGAGRPAVPGQHRVAVRAGRGRDEDLRLPGPLAADDAGHRRRLRSGGAGRRVRRQPGRDLGGAVGLLGGPPRPPEALGGGRGRSRQLRRAGAAVRGGGVRADPLPARAGDHRRGPGPAGPAGLRPRALPGRTPGPGGGRGRAGRHRVGDQPVRHRRSVLGPGQRPAGADGGGRGPGPPRGL